MQQSFFNFIRFFENYLQKCSNKLFIVQQLCYSSFYGISIINHLLIPVSVYYIFVIPEKACKLE